MESYGLSLNCSTDLGGVILLEVESYGLSRVSTARLIWAESHCSRLSPAELGGVIPQEAEVYHCIRMNWAEPHCSRKNPTDLGGVLPQEAEVTVVIV